MKLLSSYARPLRAVLLALSVTPLSAAVFQTDIHIAATNLLYEGEPLEVTNCTLTIDGPHTFASLTVQSGGIITHSPWTETDLVTGCLITVTGRVEILYGGRFDVIGRGYSTNVGIGGSVSGTGAGGGHGGYGGLSASNAPGGTAYGAITNPITLGGTGGPGIGGPGASGGGRVQLIATDSIQIDGVISAMGANATNSRSGGGAGGSIWLEAPIITGTGTITCSGGAGEPSLGGGGGGGRIGLFCRTNTFTGSIDQFGGMGYQSGGAGTLYIKSDQFTNGFAIIRNNYPGGVTSPEGATNTDMAISGMAVIYPTAPLALNNLTVHSNSWVMLTNTTPAPLTMANNLIIEPTGGICSRYYGYSSQGNGGTFTSNQKSFGGGAGHAGYGGHGNTPTTSPYYPQTGGLPYGLLNAPNQPGSRGGFNGGFGGGVVRINAGGDVIVEGTINCRGDSPVSDGPGAGSGGSVWITASTLSGSGTISVDGGAALGILGGGGSAGRIALYATNREASAFSGFISAKGGNGLYPGAAGTVFLSTTSATNLLVDNGGILTTNTSLNGLLSCNLFVSGGAAATLPSSSGNLRHTFIGSNSFLFTSLSNSWLNLSCASMEIQTGAVFRVISYEPRYYYSSPGAYGGSGSTGSGGGGGHIGAGGDGARLSTGFAPAGGAASGSSYSYSPGGAGGSPSTQTSPSPNGGGALTLTVSGLLRIDGELSANGSPGTTLNCGGGAGGSLKITPAILAGNGRITADGASGHLPYGGGGGGGRIYANPKTNEFTGVYSATGGPGYVAGGAGSVELRRTSSSSQMTLDNDGLIGTNSVVVWDYSYFSNNDLFLIGGASVSSSGIGVDNLTIGDLSQVYLSSGYSYLNVRSNLIIQPGGILKLAAAGLTGSTLSVGHLHISAGGILHSDSLIASGPGAGSPTNNQFMGGSYAGTGGLRPFFAGYGNLLQPIDFGSKGADSLSPGGKGGGSVRVTASISLTNHGRISANGQAGSRGSGGGSGGSILLTAPTIAGTGSITANGGAGSLPTGGGGGGGRISLRYGTNDLTGPIQAAGGAGAQAGGAGTIYLTNELTRASTLVVHNAGQSGAGTALSAVPGLNLVVSSGARLQPTNNLLFNSVTVEPYGVITAPVSSSSLSLATLHDFTIAPAGILHLDSLGYAPGYGPGDGFCPATEQPGSGAGHGGIGGDAPGAPGGASYGSEQWPLTPGSSGGAIGSDQARGGGALRLTVGGTLSVNGWISADGSTGTIDNSGGGSGGSILVSAKAVNGTGSIKADGGTGELFLGGGGGGGRLAIYSPANDFSGTLSVRGGDGFMPGSTGTVYTTDSSIPMTVVAQSPTGDVFDAVSVINLEFNLPPDSATIQASDFQVSTPRGLLSSTNLSVTPVNSTTWKLLIPTQTTPGTYQVQAGPEIQHLLGTPMSQPYTGVFNIALPALTGVIKTTNNTPLPDVLIHAGHQIPGTTTDATGSYTLGALTNISFTVTPSKAGWFFVPSSRSYTNLKTNCSGQDFVAVTKVAPQLTQSVSGTNLLLGWTGMSDVQYTVLTSTNLMNWWPHSEPVWGSNQWLEFQVPIAPSTPRQFLRLKATY